MEKMYFGNMGPLIIHLLVFQVLGWGESNGHLMNGLKELIKHFAGAPIFFGGRTTILW